MFRPETRLRLLRFLLVGLVVISCLILGGFWLLIVTMTPLAIVDTLYVSPYFLQTNPPGVKVSEWKNDDEGNGAVLRDGAFRNGFFDCRFVQEKDKKGHVSLVSSEITPRKIELFQAICASIILILLEIWAAYRFYRRMYRRMLSPNFSERV